MIRVLVVDDQPLAAQAHAVLVDRVPGFRTVGVAHDGSEALTRIDQGGVDLVLLDLAMPGLDGEATHRALLERDHAPDVIVVTASRDLASVRQSVRLGAVHYLVKPFGFAALQEKLDHYAAYRATTSGDGEVEGQAEIDASLSALRDHVAPRPPKGMSLETLRLVEDAVRSAPEGLSATAVAAVIGTSRVTARRYLEHLAESEEFVRRPVYGRPGRPELVYASGSGHTAEGPVTGRR